MSGIRFEPLKRCEGVNGEPCDTFFEPSRGRHCAVCANRINQLRASKWRKSTSGGGAPASGEPPGGLTPERAGGTARGASRSKPRANPRRTLETNNRRTDAS